MIQWRMKETQDDECNDTVFFTNAPEWEIEEFYQDSCTVNSNSHFLKRNAYQIILFNYYLHLKKEYHWDKDDIDFMPSLWRNLYLKMTDICIGLQICPTKSACFLTVLMIWFNSTDDKSRHFVNILSVFPVSPGMFLGFLEAMNLPNIFLENIFC